MTSEPQWEIVEHGWHAVASLSKGYQWTAYIEYVDSPFWRIWAGCMFDSLKHAQEWCHAEITHQVQKIQSEHAKEVEQEKAHEPDALNWLWSTLGSEMGEDRLAALRDEFEHRKQEEQEEQA